MKLKYIKNHYGFVIFGETIQHKDIRIPEIESAGFCYLSSEGGMVRAICYGESISLGLKSKETDSEEMTKFLNSKYY